MKKQYKTLDKSLEITLLAAVFTGACSPSVVDPKELSKMGVIVHKAIVQLAQAGAKAPFDFKTVYLNCIGNLGAPDEEAKEYLHTIAVESRTKNNEALVVVARQKAALVGLLNEASSQLGSGLVELGKFNPIITEGHKNEVKLQPMCKLKHKNTPPPGFNLVTLPRITEATYGLQGIWVLGGEPGVGKSTLGLQIGLDAQAEMDVLYYDLDGTGEHWMAYRVKQAVGKENYDHATERLYYRDSISTLDSDILQHAAPCLVIIDSIQTLPTMINHRRSGLDKWLVEFKDISKRGYTVLLISELNRLYYGQNPKMGGFKESGEIEYAATLAAQLIGEGLVEFHILKNRHKPSKGFVTYLQRRADLPFLFEEV